MPPWPSACTFGERRLDMYRFLRKVFMFRLGQRTSRGFARKIGIRRPLANIIGIIGGVKYMRRHA